MATLLNTPSGVTATGLPTPIRSSVGNPPLEKRERSAVSAAHRGDPKSSRKNLRNDHADRFALDGLNLLGTIRPKIDEAAIDRTLAHLDAGKSRVETISAKSETLADFRPDNCSDIETAIPLAKGVCRVAHPSSAKEGTTMVAPSARLGSKLSAPPMPNLTRMDIHTVVAGAPDHCGARPTLADLIAREKLRAKIEAAIARLIDALDAFDAPAEDMEPYVAGFYNGSASAADCEGGDVCDEPHDAEPDEASLGARTCLSDQRIGWGDTCGVIVDGEAKHDGREPSLGAALNQHDQRHWSQGDRRDVEFLGTEEDVHA